MSACPATDDIFRRRMDHMIDLRHLNKTTTTTEAVA